MSSAPAPAPRLFAHVRLLVSRLAGVAGFAAYFVLGPKLATECRVAAESLFVIGAILAIAGALGRLWCSSVISGRKNSELVAVGPYSLCRNPLYFFSFVGMIGVGLMSKTLIFPAVLVAVFAVYYPAVIRSEEAFLGNKFGDKFTEFVRTVPAFFPKFTGFRQDDFVSVKSSAFAREVSHSAGFLLCIPVMHLVGVLHESGVVPVFAHIW